MTTAHISRIFHNDDITYVNTRNDCTAAMVRPDGQRFHVVFGRIDRHEFVVSRAKPSRFYGTRNGAERAAHKWIA